MRVVEVLQPDLSRRKKDGECETIMAVIYLIRSTIMRLKLRHIMVLVVWEPMLGVLEQICMPRQEGEKIGPEHKATQAR